MNKYTIPQGSLIGFMSNKVKTQGGINLAQGIPGFEPPGELTDILAETAKESFHQYAPGTGNLALRELIINKYEKSIQVNQNNLLITNGATDALALIFHYISTSYPEPFSALAFSPVYESYRNLPLFYGKSFIEFNFEPTVGIDFTEFERTLNTNNVKVVFLCSPGNPFGYTFRNEDVQKLQSICESKNCFLIVDAVYQELYFNQAPVFPVHELTPHLFFVDSFSKLFSITGWRIGFFFAHEKHMSAIRNIHDYTGLCAPSVLQEALARYIQKHEYGKDYVTNLRIKLAENYRTMTKTLIKNGFQVPEANGGYFVWTKLPEQFPDGFRFAIDLYEQIKVAVVPGIHFSPRASRYIRLNLAREKTEIDFALNKIESFVNQHIY
jgi:aspartate/methionine/tyrosine aminotransferase